MGIFDQVTDEPVQFAVQNQLLIKTSIGAPSCSYLLSNGPPNKNASEQNVLLLKFLLLNFFKKLQLGTRAVS